VGTPVRGRVPQTAQSRRPAGAARLRLEAHKADDAERERAIQGRHRRNIGFRIATLGLASMLVFALTFPTVRLYLGEHQELEVLREQAQAAQEATDELKAQLRRWDDPAFVQAQARERLSYVMPGDIAFKVVDPQNARTPTPTPTSSSPVVDVRPNGAGDSDDIPWYRELWETVVAAGGVS
jgi:cell division protein FtsB